MILLAVLSASECQGDYVGLEQGLVRRIVVVAQRREVGEYLARGFPVGADERESQVAAHHLAVIDVENPTARPMHRFHVDFVEPLQHPLSSFVVPLYAQ